MENIIVSTGDIKRDYDIIKPVHLFHLSILDEDMFGEKNLSFDGAIDKIIEKLQEKTKDAGGDAIIFLRVQYSQMELRGNYYSAGEFGRMTMFGDGHPEIYTESENLEAYASNRATIKRYNMLQKETNNGKVELKMNKIIQKARENNANAIKALKKTGSYLGIGVSNIIKTIDPQAIIVGGEIVEVWDIIYPEIMKTVEKHVDQFINYKVSIFPTYNKANSALIGAATLPIMDIFRNYSITR